MPPRPVIKQRAGSARTTLPQHLSGACAMHLILGSEDDLYHPRCAGWCTVGHPAGDCGLRCQCPAHPKPAHLADYIIWMRHRGLSSRTITARMRVLARISAFARRPAAACTAADLQAWRKSIDHLTRPSICCYVSHARAFYRWLEEEGRRAGPNPARRLVAPKMGRMLPRPVTEQDVAEALAGAPDPVRCWLVLAGWAGLRAKEIALLRRNRVTDSGPRPHILVAADGTKGNSERVVPLHPDVLAELRPYLHGSASDFVFRRRDGRPGPLAPNSVSRYANAYLHSAGLGVTLHQFRHRFGTIAYQVTRDARTVQELMGHQSLQTTAGYIKIGNDDIFNAVLRLPGQRQPQPRRSESLSPWAH